MTSEATTEAPQIHKGLAGVVADTTRISKVNADTNSLLYRGYPVQDLAAQCSFEQVAYLLWHGELPTNAQLAEFTAHERSGRALDPVVKSVIDTLPTSSHPMDVCRTAASVIGARHPHSEDSSPEANLAKAKDLFAAFPAVVAYDQRRRRGQDVVEPREDLDYSANFLYMTFGEEAAPEVIEAFNVSMILYAEHSFNASTFTARVITSTLADLHSAVTGAIGALKGPLHGGANEAVMDTFEEIGTEGGDITRRAQAWLEDALATKKKIMGFGHRVYKKGDSRVPTMKAALDKMIAYYNRPDLAELYTALESAMAEKKNIKPNLDYPAGPTYHLMGFDTQTFTPLFVAARITGWTAHIMEQREANSLIRPLSEYNGPDQRSL
ncbi:bifunctional 2-methylcitrate synthase/citrate synthase [Arthrobacter crystallopoietes]|uniref:bifunctional 2-methylcitrate synthase/citrate synthase n=1 Tax=Crystallibacter crystallopoietes TaxID=37928 RepID=UPI001111236D|nr:bifunctional 2-methylcitrate synthase/citrate synthase [Arthrobacter crystallopoietes]QTG79876.1 bifunctional 2-methylcitrate synthase/citrate synthase [Arthrobacter crystallopoietes]